MTTKHTNLALVKGEVIIYDPQDRTGWCVNYYEHPILYTTSKDENIPQLDRKHFVKPKVDVEGLASNYAEREQRVLWENEHIVSEAFKAGYNAKEAEFTRDDMEKAIFAGYGMFYDDDTHDKIFEDLIKEIRPLSLPKSVTLNENKELISVEW